MTWDPDHRDRASIKEFNELEFFDGGKENEKEEVEVSPRTPSTPNRKSRAGGKRRQVQPQSIKGEHAS